MRCLIALTLLIIYWFPVAAFAASPGHDGLIHEGSIEELTREILVKELALERLNTNFRIASLHDDKWRGWRQFAYTLQNAGLTEASLIDTMVLRYRYLKKPKVVNGKRQKRIPIRRSQIVNSQIPPLVGNAIGCGGDLLELSINVNKYLRQRKQGLIPGAVRRRVNEYLSEIDQLIEKRNQVIEASSDISDTELEMIRAEGVLLSDIRNLAAIQFARYYIHAKRFSTFQTSVYLIDLLKNSTGAVSNMISIYAANHNKPRLGGPANLFTTISGLGVLAIPSGSRLCARLAGLYARRKFPELKGIRDLPGHELSMVNDYDRHLQNLVSLSAQNDTSPISEGLAHHMYVYAHQDVLFSNQESLMLREIRQDLNTTLETFLVAGTAGSTKTAAGILGMVGGYAYNRYPVLASSYSAAGATTYCAGTSAQILEVIGLKAKQQLRQHELKKQGMLPSQLRKQRLEILNIMDKLVD